MWNKQKSVVIIFILILLVTGQQNDNQNNFNKKHQHHKKFKVFKNTYSKVYESKEVEQFRFATFVENLKEIDRLNAEVTTAQFDISFFSDFTKEEFLNLFTGAHKPAMSDQDQLQNNNNSNNQNDQSNNQKSSDKSNQNEQKQIEESIPSSWDIRTDGPGLLQPVENQGQCGSCWAFSTSGAVESYYSAKKNITLNLSKQQLVDCVYDHGGCDGGWFNDAFKYIQSVGIVLNATYYPYINKDQTEPCQLSKLPKGTSFYQIQGYKKLENDTSVIKQAIMQNGALSIAVDATYWANYKSGIFTQKEKPQINHAVTLIGWGSDYWLLRNSWGSSWGEQGYIKVTNTGYSGIFPQYTYSPIK
ncbi:papain family cysteine protease (macronuclear) [Tetrahymena thermophila SB210]|uniref:Papain family cysteine protease n=1 Tax=Tetrahymena thermophila (strain SB210) TaxID=312017 RepID=Q22DX2_TETTS|nr:papain family cysteine protease [Tetrahymena thermophila SB210]EAR83540.1 papain family cysteine protease [Tetrahymena thermophila SB210]|eukprot:XP_001031203.1 papain family cysteine protease [Tetrahymena thermophila SB210]